MAEGTPNGETVKPGDSQTTVTTTTTPPQDNGVDQAEVERLRKEAEQAKMRANQLENDLKKKEEAEEALRQKQLEENNEWKTIAEQNQAKLDEIDRERQAAEAKRELESAETEALKEFPAGVIEAAKDLDLSLSENTPEAIESFKSKLNKLSEKVASDQTVASNNGRVNTNRPDRQELLVQHAQTGSSDSRALHEVIGGLNFVQHSKEINGDT